MKKSVLLVMMMLSAISTAYAQPYPQYPFGVQPQIGSKLVGVTRVDDCPNPAVIAFIQAQGEALGATYTEFPPVAGQQLCPASFFGGPTRPFTYEIPIGSGTTYVWRGGVTIGLHYWVTR